MAFELVAGLVQLVTALLLDHRGAKLKYLPFAPLYMLYYWMVNPFTVVTTFIPAVKTIFGAGSGTWVSPTRRKFSESKK
nr:hypothetical protein [Secundilactobacillus paracollinoides]